MAAMAGHRRRRDSRAAALSAARPCRSLRDLADPEKRLAAGNALRTTMAGALGWMAVAAGAIVAALNFRETGRQKRAVLELQRRGPVTERFGKAIEQ